MHVLWRFIFLAKDCLNRSFHQHLQMNFPDLAKLLEARITVIADHEFRDRDPEAHLEALKHVSEAIVSWHEAHRNKIDGNLDHFLTGASYQKALLYLETGTR